jgi:hypothetical protein
VLADAIAMAAGAHALGLLDYDGRLTKISLN